MPTAFLDSSAALKLYFEETGSESMRAFAGRGLPCAICSIGAVEFRAVVRAKERSRVLSGGDARSMLVHFEQRVRHAWTYQPVNEVVFALSAVLIDRHPLRAPDALQLAAAMVLLQIQPIEFVSSDHRLLEAARREGLACWDPAGGVE
ncbi:MAG: PIN domain-containing protein [Acidobacteria bacterium]|nr:MAG: PIN domain-containing protein [Acidobacteriota bacterium]